MPISMDGVSLGLIETQGLVGLIAATDAAVKAAPVVVRSFERASGGLVVTMIVGDVAAVQEAVAVGAEQAAAVGRLVSSHVIPRPDRDVWRMLGVPAPAEAAAKPARPAVRAPDDEDLGSLPVRELRRMARSMPGMPLSGREISRVSKAELVAAMRKAR